MEKRRNYKREPLTESEKADPAFMKQYAYAVTGRRITTVLLGVIALSLIAIIIVLILKLYYAALFISPVPLTALTMLALNIFMFSGKDINAAPKPEQKEDAGAAPEKADKEEPNK